MQLLNQILLLLAFLSFVAALIGLPPNMARWNMVALGLAFWVLTEMLEAFHASFHAG